MRPHLIKARKDRKQTQVEVARALGISRPFYTQIERGERNPSLELTLKIGAYFNQPVEFLLQREPPVKVLAS